MRVEAKNFRILRKDAHPRQKAARQRDRAKRFIKPNVGESVDRRREVIAGQFVLAIGIWEVGLRKC